MAAPAGVGDDCYIIVSPFPKLYQTEGGLDSQLANNGECIRSLLE